MARFDALTDHEDTGTGNSQGVSIFKENFQYARRIGMTRTEARNFAVDYHRKYTAKEQTDNWEEFAPTIQDEATSAFDYVLFNQLVRKLAARSNEKQAEFLFLLIRMEDLERYMDKGNLETAVRYCGEFYPEEVKDIAVKMGFTIRPNGSCNSMARYRRQFRELASAFA